MRTIIRVIESISQWSGAVVCWGCVVLVMVFSYEVFMRYVLRSPTSWSYEFSCMVGLTIGVVGLAYTHRHHGHIRVDVFYRLLSPRGRAIADVIGGLLLFFPLMIVLIYISASWMWHAWSIGEVFIKTYWYPPTWPIRTLMFLGLVMFLFQGVAEFVRDLHFAIRNKPL